MNDLISSSLTGQLKEFEERVVKAINSFGSMESAAEAVAKRLAASLSVGERS